MYRLELHCHNSEVSTCSKCPAETLHAQDTLEDFDRDFAFRIETVDQEHKQRINNKQNQKDQ